MVLLYTEKSNLATLSAIFEMMFLTVSGFTLFINVIFKIVLPLNEKYMASVEYSILPVIPVISFTQALLSLNIFSVP